MDNLKVYRIKREEFMALKDIWDDLAQKEKSTMFQMFDWAYNWWKAYEEDKELLVLTVKEKDSVIAIAPLVITREPFNRIPARKVELMYRTNFIAPYKKDKVIDNILGYLCDIKNSWDVVDFSDINCDKKITDALRKNAEKYHLDFMLNNGDPYPYVMIDRSWEDYWSGRSKRFRRNIRHSYRLMEKMGGMDIKVKFYDGSQSDLLHERFRKMRELSLKSWKSDKGVAIASNKKNEAFHIGALDIFSMIGEIEMSFLEHKGVPIAGTLGIIHKNVFYGFNTFYDRKYYKISPGNILTHAVLKNVFERGDIKSIEFLRGIFPQKLLWLTGMHEKARVAIFKRSPRSLFLRFTETHLKPLVNFIRSFRHARD